MNSRSAVVYGKVLSALNFQSELPNGSGPEIKTGRDYQL